MKLHAPLHMVGLLALLCLQSQARLPTHSGAAITLVPEEIKQPDVGFMPAPEMFKEIAVFSAESAPYAALPGAIFNDPGRALTSGSLVALTGHGGPREEVCGAPMGSIHAKTALGLTT